MSQSQSINKNKGCDGLTHTKKWVDESRGRKALYIYTSYGGKKKTSKIQIYSNGQLEIIWIYSPAPKFFGGGKYILRIMILEVLNKYPDKIEEAIEVQTHLGALNFFQRLGFEYSKYHDHDKDHTVGSHTIKLIIDMRKLIQMLNLDIE